MIFSMALESANRSLTPNELLRGLQRVIGKAFWDISHAPAPADHSNRRTKPEGYAVWEIHPVMALQVDQ